MKAAIFLLALCVPVWAGLADGEHAAQNGDFRTAIAELRPLADQGSDEAQAWLGGVYFRQGNYEEAQWWLSLAAGQGHPVAQTFLGLMYQDGKGVPQDRIEAYQWLVLASAQDARAIGLRVRLASLLTAAEIVEGERRAEEWKPEKGLFVPRPKAGPVIPSDPRGRA